MRIGIDFDNTIACYDGVFHKAALERSLIPHDLPASKNAVRDYLNGSGRKDDFTLLQGYVYGTRMDLVSLYPGLAEFVSRVRSEGHRIFIVSHKTKYPLLGPAYDLHAAARIFLEAQHLSAIAAEDIYFELTKEEKVARIAALGCDVFIDDLPEILAMPGLPARTRRILFDPAGDHAARNLDPAIERHQSWGGIGAILLGDSNG